MSQSGTLIISKEDFDAVIFDMDGVITRTADVHFRAWKKMFDDYLRERGQRDGRDYGEFDEAAYNRFVDGKPRVDGVRDYLASLGIELPEGNPDDPPERETVQGLGNRKNADFNRVLDAQGVKRYESTVRFIEDLHRCGIRTAIISSSKNARRVLASAGVTDLFDARVDGQDALELGIPGKPAPDVFLAAAGALGVAPSRAVVVEDAQSGVEAGRKGGFALVIGINRGDQHQELARYAHRVVDDLCQVGVAPYQRSVCDLPSALTHLEEIAARLEGANPAVFLDYDGTLTPIVERPEDARLDETTREAVEALGRLCPVAVLSGRDLPDVRSRVGIEGIFYAGSHGFDILTPEGKSKVWGRVQDMTGALKVAADRLRQRLGGMEGVQLEPKKFALAVHFRRASQKSIPAIEKAVDEVVAEAQGLRKTGGKRIFELRPDVDWHKGKALAWLLEELRATRPELLPLFIGDDLTDEDGLREIGEAGIGILVRGEQRPSYARYGLEDPGEVRLFLRQLARMLQVRREA